MVLRPEDSASGSAQGKTGDRPGCAFIAAFIAGGAVISVILSFLVAFLWLGIEEHRIQNTGLSRPGYNMVAFNIVFNVLLSAFLAAVFCSIGALVGGGITRNPKKGVKVGALVGVALAVAAPWIWFLTSMNPPTVRSGRPAVWCPIAQETWEEIDGYMLEYQKAHDAENDERKARLRQMVSDTLPDCAAPAAAAVKSWMYGVDKDDEDRMATAERRYRAEVRRLD